MLAGRGSTARLTVASALLWSTASVCLAQHPVPLGPEFRVDEGTAPASGFAAAGDGAGGFVVVWASTDGSGNGVFGRRFDPAGNPLGPSFQVNAYTTGRQWWFDVAMNTSGDFVVVWESQPAAYGDRDIFGRRYDASGNAMGPEFLVTVATLGTQAYPAVAMAGDGSFVVVWDGDTQAMSYRGIFARRFDALGAAAGKDLWVWSDFARRGADIAMNPSGEFVIVSGAMRARRFDAAANAVGPDFALSSTSNNVLPDVALDASGGFVVAWSRRYPGALHEDVRARRFDASDSPQPEFTVHTYTTGYQMSPSVATFRNDEFVVVWQHTLTAGNSDVFGRRFDVAGNAMSAEFRVNAYTTGQQVGGIAATSPDSFVVVWTSFGSPGGVFARRFSLTPDDVFADGFESGDTSGWSLTQADGGDLAVSDSAAMASTAFGLRALVDDQAGIFVQDDSPNQEARYRARFYFDPGTFDPGEAAGHQRTRIFLAFDDTPLKRLVQVVLRRLGGQYSVAGQVRQDDNTLVATGFIPITAAPHAIELDWQRATGTGVADGRFELWIDGTSVAALTGIDNDERPIEFVRMGAMSVKSGAAGTLAFDEFVSRRWTYIGP